MSHRYSIGQIAGWTLDGVWQWIRHEVPLPGFGPKYVGRSAPGWFTSVKPWYDWYYCTDNYGYPTDCWYGNYIDACWKCLGHWVDEAADDVGGAVSGAILGLLGSVAWPFSTFSQWITWLRDLTGGYKPAWSSSLANATDRLFWWLPESIRQDWTSWEALWEGIKESVRSWARVRYDAAKAWADAAWKWVLKEGADLKAWWDGAHKWLDDFRQNAEAWVRSWLGPAWDWLVGFRNDPYGTIVGLLGDTWEGLKTFAQEALPFYYNLWGSFWQEMGEFWPDPLGYLYDRVEDFLIEKW